MNADAASIGEQTTYRHATFDDCDLIFAWASDPQTRENSHNSKPIEYESHVLWFQKKLDSSDSWIYIILRNGSPVGLLRLDKGKNADLIVNYSVARESRRTGVGKEIVRMIPQIIGNENIPCDRVVAEVLCANDASNKIFSFAGYQKQDDGNQNIYIKKLK